tara:strand:- start:188 stop:415 length:228 start_codon:yes stop_codon:yes gene_type:complete
MFYSANGDFKNNDVIEKFTEIESDDIDIKFHYLNKKIIDISNENKLLKKRINELSKLTKKLEIEKADYFYLDNKN